MQRQDYIERMIAQIAEAIGRALGLARSGQPIEAQSELDAAWSGALGLSRGDVQRLDDVTLRALLGAKRTAAARLLDAEAELKELQGDLASPPQLRALATTLRR
jgi:hypothetical protein